ncbi:DUF4097 family beta strand repeat-containing protein [Calditrichota bacterium LG25]
MLRTLLSILLLVSCSLADNFTETVEKHFDASNLTKIIISTTNGDISIKPGDSNQIQLKAVKRIKGSKNEKDRLLNSIQIEAIQENGVLKIKVKRKKTRGFFLSRFLDFGSGDYSVNIQLKIPERLQVKAHSTNGEIEVFNINGGLELATTNGDIKALDVQHIREIHSTNGRVKVEFAKLPDTDEIEISTTNGEIDVLVPEHDTCNIKAFTNNGEIDCRLSTANAVSRTDTHLEIENGAHLPTLFLKTTNGNINIYSR